MKIAYPLLLLALLAPATATAQTPPPDERAAAQAMADATKRASADIDELIDDVPDVGCKQFSTLPDRHELGGFTLWMASTVRQIASVIAPRTRELRGELANIRTADRALIAGRASWRRWMRATENVEPAADDPCATIRRWRTAGYPRSTVREAERMIARFVPTRGMERRTRAATRRMAELGVAGKAARSFLLFSY